MALLVGRQWWASLTRRSERCRKWSTSAATWLLLYNHISVNKTSAKMLRQIGIDSHQTDGNLAIFRIWHNAVTFRYHTCLRLEGNLLLVMQLFCYKGDPRLNVCCENFVEKSDECCTWSRITYGSAVYWLLWVSANTSSLIVSSAQNVPQPNAGPFVPPLATISSEVIVYSGRLTSRPAVVCWHLRRVMRCLCT